ncbi:HTH-type transcriptional regulator SyrM 1 [Thalassocella blandensis]|nr:HTH-type transcriptional regulator SyrM 1 [Thalassocella blandensis]
MFPIENMNITGKDLNLLHLFCVLNEERNLSNAAKRLALSQPAISHKLNKLRKEFDDQLFVRASRGLSLTPLAEKLSPQITELVKSLEQFYCQIDDACFLDNEDTVNIYTTDYTELLLMPKLLTIVAEKAPNLKLVCHHTQGKLPKSELESGQCDIAIAGFYKELPESYYQQHVRKERFVVLANSRNPLVQGDMTLEAFLHSRHILTTLTGDLDGIVDKELKKMQCKRKVVAGLSSFLTPPLIVEASDHILVCLESIANTSLARNYDLVKHECPITLPEVNITQIWHSRTHQDPMRRWLREEIKALLGQP